MSFCHILYHIIKHLKICVFRIIALIKLKV